MNKLSCNELLVDLEDYFYESLAEIKQHCEDFYKKRHNNLNQIECFAVEIHNQSFQKVREFILRKEGGESLQIFGEKHPQSILMIGNLTEN